FYQYRDADVLEAKAHPAAALFHEFASGNNATLFDHGIATPLTSAQSARALVAPQQFALGGGVSQPFNRCNAPLIAGLVVLVRGENLFNALLLDALLYQRGGERPIVSESDDAPSWEAEMPPEAAKRPPKGYLEYLTWQSRRVLLDTQDGAVHSARILQGL